MRYMGGKAKIAKEIVSVIQTRKSNRTLCVEPFMGGCNVTPHLAQIFETVLAYDERLDMVLLRQALAEGWDPPASVSEDEYRALKRAEPSALRGFVGQGCSFGGIWWGGYARGDGARNYATEARNTLIKETKLMANAIFGIGDFMYDVPLRGDAVLYCDPPYAGTAGYGQGGFDHGRFWRRIRQWVNAGALAFVSEQIAPEDFVPIWKTQKTKGLRASDGTHEALSERLFVHESQA